MQIICKGTQEKQQILRKMRKKLIPTRKKKGRNQCKQHRHKPASEYMQEYIEEELRKVVE